MIPVDSRTGLVTGVRTALLRGCLHVVFADLAATTGYGLPLGNPTVSGASWHDPAEARRRALGEAAERHCGHLVPTGRLVEATWHELAPAAVDPQELALYSPAQTVRGGFPFTGLARADRTHWVRGTRAGGAPVWVPAALAWLTPFSVRSRPVVLPVSAGIAPAPTSPPRAPQRWRRSWSGTHWPPPGLRGAPSRTWRACGCPRSPACG